MIGGILLLASWGLWRMDTQGGGSYFLAAIDKSRARAAGDQMNHFRLLLARYREQNGRYPTTLRELREGIDPVDDRDPWGNSYAYVSDGSTYTITAAYVQRQSVGPAEEVTRALLPNGERITTRRVTATDE